MLVANSKIVPGTNRRKLQSVLGFAIRHQHLFEDEPGSASLFLKMASPQDLSISNTFGNGFWIQALLLSSFVCNLV